ncbi:MAG: peptide-methionine (R)-S-oxide reductase MsrB [Haliscomenobacter sp.]|nr:peptide-methionine (R)-S-oxide reductase MsrB [Haliscomenobacter sp.]
MGLLSGCNQAQDSAHGRDKSEQGVKRVFVNLKGDTVGPVVRSEEEWKQILTPEAYQILRHSATECAFTGALYENNEKGVYLCGGCRLPLFSSGTKFESGTGWPRLFQPYRKDHIEELRDASYGMVRIEVLCARCGGHLGHVFEDGPAPTGLRYCINSASLEFVPERKEKGKN